MGKSSSANNDPSDNKHDQKLQAVLLADSYTNAFHPVTLEPYSPGRSAGDAGAGITSQRPLTLCPLNNVPLLHHTIDFLAGAGVEELYILCSSGADALEEYIYLHASNASTASSSSANDDAAGGDGRRESRRESTAGGGGGGGLTKTIWSSKLTIMILRDTGCTNAGDALRELDRRNVIKSDPFLLMQGDVVTNVDVTQVLKDHAERRKKDSAAIMTVLLQEVGGWGLDEGDDDDYVGRNEDDDDDDDDGGGGFTSNDDEADENDNDATNKNKIKINNNSNNSNSNKRNTQRNINDHNHSSNYNHQLPPLRSSTDDLLLALDTTHQNRILLWDSHPHNSQTTLPTSFFHENSSSITLTRNYLDVGLDICSPDVLARFSDEFDYRHLREQFVVNSVVEEEVGLQSRIFACMLKRGEYAGRIGDMRRYHRVSMDLLRRWCYPLVPDNYNWNHAVGEKREYGGNDAASYVVERHLVYRDCGKGHTRSHVGRSTQLLGPLLLGPNGSIGEHCLLQRSVLGPNCTIMDHCEVIDSHFWGNVLVEEGAKIIGAILCEGAIVKKGAVVEKGCVVGAGCVVGEGMVLKEFTRITLAAEAEEEDDYSGFDDSSSDGSEEESSSDDEEDSSGDDDEDGEKEENSSNGKAKTASTKVVDTQRVASAGSNIANDTITNHAILGNDGLGRVWIPAPPDDYESDDDEDDGDGGDKRQAIAMELMKSGSIGYDMTLIYRQWKKLQMEDDDQFSEEGMDSDEDDDMDIMDDDLFHSMNSSSIPVSSHLDDEGMLIAGRQKGVDVIKELRDICLEHETSSPVENLRIELNSFKFSQNATYADCCKGAMMAVMDKIFEKQSDDNQLSAGKLVASLRKALEYWGSLFQSICMGSEEEKAIIHSLETMALGGGKAATILGQEPAFRFVLQTLHDQEIVNEEAIFEWAGERKEEAKDSPKGQLFFQQPTQDFLEWLEEDSSGSEEDDDDDGSDEDSD